MKENEKPNVPQSRPLADGDAEKVAGGLPLGRPSDLVCRRCGRRFTDAGAYFEHVAMHDI